MGLKCTLVYPQSLNTCFTFILDYHLLRCVMKFSTVVSERRHIIKKKVGANTENGIEENINKEKEDEDDYDHNMTIMLYDLIQNQLIELVKLISAVSHLS